MRSSTLLAHCAALLGLVAAQDGYLYTIDQSVHSSSTSSIDSNTASSIIARRRGLTDSRYLHTFDESILDEIVKFGGWQQPLFAEGVGEAPGKLFIRISGFDGKVFDLDSAMPDLWIENPTKNLKDDFKVDNNRADVCEYTIPPSENVKNSKGVEVVFSYPVEEGLSCIPKREIQFIPLIMSLHSVLPTDVTNIAQTIGPLIRVLRHFASTENVESTVLLLPSKMASKPAHSNNKRADPEEEPLDLPVPVAAPLDTVQISKSNSSSNFTLPRIVPQCFTSQAACDNTTNSCSGHGKCYKAHDKCYKCKCGTTIVRTNKDGTTKSVQWGGNACQKKDVSVPFVLFASFGVVMTALVAGGIGLLYDMGNQELPSVIGAGVSGPTAHK